MKQIQLIILFLTMGVQAALSQNVNVVVNNINLRSDSANINFDRANFSLQNG